MSIDHLYCFFLFNSLRTLKYILFKQINISMALPEWINLNSLFEHQISIKFILFE